MRTLATFVWNAIYSKDKAFFRLKIIKMSESYPYDQSDMQAQRFQVMQNCLFDKSSFAQLYLDMMLAEIATCHRNLPSPTSLVGSIV